jgi:hypothetical protein
LTPITTPITGANRWSISARELGVWSLATLAIGYFARDMRAGSDVSGPELQALLDGIVSDSAFVVFAWIFIFARAARTLSAEAASAQQICGALLAGAISVAPFRLANASALVILGLNFLLTPGSRRPGRDIAWCLFALALQSIWLSSLVAPMHVLVGHLDARICGLLLDLLNMAAHAQGGVVENATTGFSLVILPPCASSFPLAAVMLAFTVTTLYMGQQPQLRQLPFLAASLLASIVLTEWRLAFLGIDQASYEFWHTGPGTTVYAMAALGLAVLLPIIAARRSGLIADLAPDRRLA